MRTRRLKAHPDASSGFYHCMSRVVDRQFIFGEIEKEHFARLMRQYAHFCGIQILTFCLMGNHFHLLIEVSKRPESPPNDAELLQRISAIYPPAHVEQIRRQLADTSLLSIQKDALRQRFWQRMGDISQYLKELKQRFSQWHNLRHGRRGTLWEERFKSVLIGAEGSALSTIAAYIDLNPVRAGLVADPARYRWSGYGQAMAGRPEALRGYQALVAVRDSLSLNPAQALKHYRAGLFDYAERKGVFSSNHSRKNTDNTAMPSASARRPHKLFRDPGLVGQLLHQISYFTNGAVIGTRSFVESMALHHQHWLQRKRQPSPHPVSNLESHSLFSLRPSRILAGS